MFYRIENNNLKDYADYKYLDDCNFTDIVTQDEIDKYPNKVIIINNNLVLNPNFEEEEKQKKKEQVAMLSMTKLDFVKALEPNGVNYYEHIIPLLNSNLEAKKQWDLCERVYRFNPLLDELAKGFGITPNQLDKIFGGQ